MSNALRETVTAQLLNLASDSRAAAAQALGEYGVKTLARLESRHLASFSQTVRAMHIRYLLKRLEDVSLT